MLFTSLAVLKIGGIALGTDVIVGSTVVKFWKAVDNGDIKFKNIFKKSRIKRRSRW